MTEAKADRGWQFLTVADAAHELELPRLRVRELAARGFLPARRDNNGLLRVDIPDGWARPDAGPIEDKLKPEALVSLLFDEIEELQSDAVDRGAEIAALQDIAARQASALDRAEMAIADAEQKQNRLSGLLDRALEHLEDSAARDAPRFNVSDRALAQLDTGLDQLSRFDDLLSRAVALAETRPADGARALDTADRAFAMLDQALAEAEARQQEARRAEQMLDRALTAGEQMQTWISAQQ
ncbi:MAG: hypothetical protein AAGA05_15270, partial [Pseudomonadota bacterium]